MNGRFAANMGVYTSTDGISFDLDMPQDEIDDNASRGWYLPSVPITANKCFSIKSEDWVKFTDYCPDTDNFKNLFRQLYECIVYNKETDDEGSLAIVYDNQEYNASNDSSINCIYLPDTITLSKSFSQYMSDLNVDSYSPMFIHNSTSEEINNLNLIFKNIQNENKQYYIDIFGNSSLIESANYMIMISNYYNCTSEDIKEQFGCVYVSSDGITFNKISIDKNAYFSSELYNSEYGVILTCDEDWINLRCNVEFDATNTWSDIISDVLYCRYINFEGVFIYSSGRKEWVQYPNNLAISESEVFDSYFYNDEGIKKGTLRSSPRIGNTLTNKYELQPKLDAYVNIINASIPSTINNLAYTFQDYYGKLPNFNVPERTILNTKAMYYNANIVGDVINLDTSKVTDMSYMFYNTVISDDGNNISIPIINTNSVTNMNNMFCNGLWDRYTLESKENILNSLPNFTQIRNASSNTLSYIGLENVSLENVSKAPLRKSNEKGWDIPFPLYILTYTTIDNPVETTEIIYGPELSSSEYNSGTKLRNYLNNIPISNVVNLSIKGTEEMTNMQRIVGQGSYSDRLDNLVSLNLYNTANVTHMYSAFSYCSGLQNISNFDTSKVTSMGSMFSGCSNLTTIPNFNTSNVTYMSFMMDGCSNLITMPNLNTSKVTSMSDMFQSCDNLTTVPNFNTINVKDMYGMFFDCDNLTTVPNFNTSNVTNMGRTFLGCNNLTTVPNFNTSKVTNMEGMFQSCDNLTTVPNFNTINVKDMGYMFYYTNLTTIPNFNTSNVTDMGSMFRQCYNLTTVPQFNTSNVTNMYNMLNNSNNISTSSIQNIVKSLPLYENIQGSTDNTLNYIGFSSNQINKVDRLVALNAVNRGWNVPINWKTFNITYTTVSDPTTPVTITLQETAQNYDNSTNASWVRNAMNNIPKQQINTIIDITGIDTVSNFYNFFDDCYNLTTIQNLGISDVAQNMSEMFFWCGRLTTIPNFDTSSVTDMFSTFEGCESLTAVPNFDTGKVETMRRAFLCCYNLTTIPNFNTSNVTNMCEMFCSCENLTEVPSFDTGKVTDMSYMFIYCYNLTSVPNFNTINVTDMECMFQYCNNLTTVPNFDTSNVTDMSAMLYDCNINTVPNFNTINVTDMECMFQYCNNLTTVPNFNTSKVTDMGRMFQSCRNILEVPNFNTINVTNMYSMFNNCTNLTTAPDLNTSNVTHMSDMFYNCNNLTTVPNFNTSKVTDMSRMFYSCNSLSDDSYATIANMLPLAQNLTNQTVANIGLNVVRFTDEQLNILTQKGYTDTIVYSSVYDIYYK